MKLFFDGGWRPSTGMETAVVVQGREYVRQGLGPGTSLEAEWRALILAAQVARDLGLVEPVFLGDSLAVVGQANAIAPCRGECLRHFESLAGLLPASGRVRFRHVKRSQNLAGIALARLHIR